MPLTVTGCALFGEPFDCKVPFDAVFAIVGDEERGMVWQGKVPEELRGDIAVATEKPKA